MTQLPHLDFARSRLLRVSVALILLGFASRLRADRPTSTVPEIGIRDRTPNLVALVNATIVVKPGKTIETGSLVIDHGVITSVGTELSIPTHANILDMKGKVVYPALFDAYSEIELQQEQSPSAHWNKRVRPERNAAVDWRPSDAANSKLREAGFALRLVAPSDGVFKGTSAIVTTGNATASDSIVANRVAHHIRLTSRPGANRTEYPRSPMGAVALARQSLYDANWYRDAWRAFRRGNEVPRPESNIALKVISKAANDDSLFIFDAPDEQYALRANRFAVEFDLHHVAIRGSGREYQRIDAIARAGRTIIVPVNFPKPPNVATPESARDANLSELMHWHFAPENPTYLQDAGLTIAVSSHGLKDKIEFREKIRQAVQRGWDADDALRACTLAPAELFGINDKVGTIEVGKAAHLMITDGDWLEEETKVLETWVDGKRFEHDPAQVDSFSGTWMLSLDSADGSRTKLFLAIDKKKDKLVGTVSTNPPTDKPEQKAETTPPTEEKSSAEQPSEDEPTKLKSLVASFGRITASFSADLWDSKGTVRITGTLVEGTSSPSLIGQLVDETGKRVGFTGARQADVGDTKREGDPPGDEQNASDPEGSEHDDKFELALNYPLGAHGVPVAERTTDLVLIENATIWTCGPDGVIPHASILIDEGKIVAVGSDIVVPRGATRLNAQGKQITPGIIDCHSHMATDGGVNEGTQAITAEVRIGDFIDATDVTIYRQLAGGVTTANVLHGSANPIGGQNQVVKLRWGQLPESMKFAEAPQGIKFALGENVKQSNWGEEFRTRYPQSRLGVEQIMRDAFIAAKQYEREWNQWKTTGKGIPPRKDLELDVLLEIIQGERWIHCHSYRQDEILALMRTLESFDITIGTFQHILEGYKVAKEMAEHGAMGSAFSDWWAYKFEVYDAIPYNGALMHDAGIVVSFNSDDAELGRHLNHEAAKATKYGGVTSEEALKFVTLNPAKQLRIDQYVGSLEVGKHADFVVWSGDPLQITSRCEQTWIDGIRYFDIHEDQAARKTQAELKAKLVRRILKSGETMKKPGEHEELLRHLFPRHDEYCGHGHGH